MNAATFLSELRQQDIRVWLDGDELRCSARAGALTAELRERLRQHRDDIERFLRSAKTVATQQAAIVPMQAGGDKTPVFAVPGHNGDVFCYRALSQALPGQPFYGLQPPGLDGRTDPLASITDLAGYFKEQILAFRPTGSCIVAGFCAGGCVAFELAQQLLSAGGDVAFLALFGSPHPDFFRPLQQFRYRVEHKMHRWGMHARALAGKTWGERVRYLENWLRQRRAEAEEEARESDPVLRLRARVEEVTLAAVRVYRPEFYPGKVHLFMPSRAWAQSSFSPLRWQMVSGTSEIHFGPEGCTGDDMLLAEYAPVFADLFRGCCEPPPTTR